MGSMLSTASEETRRSQDGGQARRNVILGAETDASKKHACHIIPWASRFFGRSSVHWRKAGEEAAATAVLKGLGRASEPA